jgi:hypothetical protein
VSWRRGAFRRRTVIELRREPGPPERGLLTVTANGLPLTVELTLNDGSTERQVTASSMAIADPVGLLSASVTLPDDLTSELKIWTHAVTHDGESTAIAGVVSVIDGGQVRELRLASGDGQVIMSNPGGTIRLDLSQPAR